ncbi:MAG: DUF2283 domain-containing protein [Streptosporangiaceae bacterium]
MISQSYDLDAGALYIELADREVARTVQVDAGTLVDLDPAGVVVGIEVIQPERSWPLEEILSRFAVAQQDARELRVYFPHPVAIVPPLHPAARVPVAVSLLRDLVRKNCLLAQAAEAPERARRGSAWSDGHRDHLECVRGRCAGPPVPRLRPTLGRAARPARLHGPPRRSENLSCR